MKKYLLVLFLVASIVPSIAFASWYNPFSWNWGALFSSPVQTKIQNPNSTTTNNQAVDSISSTPQVETPKTKTSVKLPSNTVPVPNISKIAGCTSTTGYSSTTGLSCSGNGTCASGTTLDTSTGECVTPLAYCQNKNGQNATYNSTNNSCGCVTGYTLNSNNTCVVQETGYQICSDQFSNETWDGTMVNGKYNCVCQAGYVLNGAGTGCQIPHVQEQAINPALASLESQYTQIINDINTDCNNADAGQPVARCELTESKLQSVLEQEAAIGVSKQEVAPELSALQDAYNKLQTEYYSVEGGGIDMELMQGEQANIAAEMQILANDETMFTN
jgi:hypothetical protein